MNLMKWFRKNNMKVMAIVIIIILFGFIGGEFFRQLGQRSAGRHRTIAYHGDDTKITNNDLFLAQQELGVLKSLGSTVLLRSIRLPLLRVQDLRTLLLAELLFSEQRASPQIISQIKSAINQGQYRIADKQIRDIYSGPVSSDMYWLLLRDEAEQAGIRVPKQDAGDLLGQAIPQLFDGTTYSQLIGPMVNQQGVPEEYILTTFAKLLAVIEYAKIMCSSEDITNSQMMHNASKDNETIDVEFVRLDSAVFAETQDEPGEEKIVEHFDRYKNFFAGDISEENPYGFGYKLTDRVRLEYIAVKLDDVSQAVAKPTQEETEEFYQKYREQFTEQVPSDANDPNSPLVVRIKSYGEMASLISEQILQDKTDSEAEKILQEAKTLTEAGFENMDMAVEELSDEQFREAALAGDYKSAADQLTKKYNVKVYAGQTGLLSAIDMQANEYLPRLYIRGYGYIVQIAFAIKELGSSELEFFDAQTPRMYENIGPARDIGERIMVVVRATAAKKSSVPESINQTYSGKMFKLDQGQEDEDVYSTKEEVVEDLKKLAAMDTVKSKADELIGLAAKDGWENAIKKFNELYGQQASESDPNVFKLQNLPNLQRISTTSIGAWAAQSQGNPMARSIVNQGKKERQLRNQFYSLVPQDANTIANLPVTLEFKPDMCYYCLKNISVEHLDQQQYEATKTVQAYKEDIVDFQSLAAVHFNPENVLNRMNFRWAGIKEETTDANAPAVPTESEEAL